MIYARKFKEAIIQKHLLPGGPTLAILAKENNIPVGTIYGWKNGMVTLVYWVTTQEEPS